MPGAGDKTFAAFLKRFDDVEIVRGPSGCSAHQSHISGEQKSQENLYDFQVHEPFEQSCTPCYGLALMETRILGINT